MAAEVEGMITVREAEVLAALAGNLTNAEIAKRLYISVRTVESHVSSLLRKLGTQDRRALAALARERERASALEHIVANRFSPREHGLFMRVEWSERRRMDPARLRTRVVGRKDRPAQQWVDDSTLNRAVRRSRGSGDLLYLLEAEPDHRESEATEICDVRLGETEYPEAVAVADLRVTEPAQLSQADAALESRLREYLASAVPSALCVNVVVLGPEDELLCVRRSGGVDSASGRWTVGVVESMKQTDPDFYELARRALDEELAIGAQEVLDLQLAWLGVYRPVLRGHLVAVARVAVPAGEWETRRRRASHSYEADEVSALVLDATLLDEFFQSPIRDDPHDAHPQFDFGGRQWVDHARLAVREAERFRAVLS